MYLLVRHHLWRWAQPHGREDEEASHHPVDSLAGGTIAEILADDPQDLVQKAVGGWVREAGKRDPGRLRVFLDRHAPTMPRTALRYAIEHLDPASRRGYLERRQRESDS